MRLVPNFLKPKSAESRPPISAPVPGTLRRIAPNRDGSLPAGAAPGASTGMPHNEYPHNRPTPNSVPMRGGDGGMRLLQLPPGASLAEPMPQAHAHGDSVPIESLGWPQNNRTTNNYNRLREEHKQALNDLNAARMGRPYLTQEEKSTLSGAEWKARKREIAAERKAAKSGIHELEKAERHARRSVDVYKSRFSKELTAEADYRQTRASSSASGSRSGLAHGSLATPADFLEPGPVPRRPAPTFAPMRRSQAPGLETIQERDPSPQPMPRGSEPSQDRMQDSGRGGPLSQRLNELKDEYRSAKNTYHGMKSEKSLHSADALAAARRRYKQAENDLEAFRRGSRTDLRLEEQNQGLPPLDALRAMLHPRGNDNYPVFPVPPRAPGGTLERPSAPGPDHPRNRTEWE